MKKLFSLVLYILIFTALILFLLRSQVYRILLPQNVNAPYEKELSGLAAESLKNDEVPVSAIIVYNYDIIGKGYNTVVRDSNIGGHAEINAISDAIKNIGLTAFTSLNRDSLSLITTFEPCAMCKGAIKEYNIKHVEFVKPRALSYWLDLELKDVAYEIHKKKVDTVTMPDSLFEVHPPSPVTDKKISIKKK